MQSFATALLRRICWYQLPVVQVPITPVPDDGRGGRGHDELPPNSFDRSDRMFLAVAVKAKATVWNAADSDWAEDADLMAGLNVRVRQLCPKLNRRSSTKRSARSAG